MCIIHVQFKISHQILPHQGFSKDIKPVCLGLTKEETFFKVVGNKTKLVPVDLCPQIMLIGYKSFYLMTTNISLAFLMKNSNSYEEAPNDDCLIIHKQRKKSFYT